jgi:hypothetical protein
VDPMCAPAVQPGRACCCNLHLKHACPRPDQIDAMPSQRKVNLTTTLLTKLLTNPLAQSRSTADSGDQSPASRPDHLTGRLSMAWKRSGSSLLSPTCLGDYRIFGRSIHRTIMLEVVGSAATLARAIHIAASRTLSLTSSS